VHVRNPLTTGIEEYPVHMQTLVLTKSPNEGSAGNDETNVNSVEGQPTSMDVSMSFELDPQLVPKLYSTVPTDIRAIEHACVKQAIRQSLQEVVGNEPIADLIGPRKAEMVARTQAALQHRLTPSGILVKQFTLNEIRPPAAVASAEQAEAEHREHDGGDCHVDPVALVEEGDEGEDHARDRRGDEREEAGRDDAAAVSGRGLGDDAADVAEGDGLAAEEAVRGGLAAVAVEVEDAADERDRRRREHAGAEELPHERLEVLVAPRVA
jgi:regulator of protease activity HflC (stomatin/prohibitin superfamily)